MTLAVKHAFISGKSDGPDATVVRPSNWNENHTISSGAGVVLGSDTSGPASIQELPLALTPAGDAALTSAKGYFLGAKGTTAQRIATVAGGRRWNTDDVGEEYYDGTAWQGVASKTYVADAIAAAAGFTTGDVKLTIKTTADAGWVMFTDGTLGSATSGATYAHADAEDLYLALWGAVSDTWAPVSGGRGANAAADWAANKPIGLLKVLGRAWAVAGAGAGLTARALGSNVGDEGYSLTDADLPITSGQTTPSVSGGAVIGIGPQTPTPISLMQPSVFLNAMIKL